MNTEELDKGLDEAHTILLIDNLNKKVEEYQKRIAELEASQPKWISVKDRLPKDCTDVLTNTLVGCYVGYYDNDVGLWYETGPTEVTHWMPLPEPPTEKEK